MSEREVGCLVQEKLAPVTKDKAAYKREKSTHCSPFA